MPDLFDTLFSDLRDSVTAFNRLLGAGLLFALVCHFYVVEPYFRHKAEEQRFRDDLVQKTNSVDELVQELKRLEPLTQSATQTLADVRAQIRGYPDHLRACLPEIRRAVVSGSDSFAGQQQAPTRVADFLMPSKIKDFEAGVRWYVETWFSNLTARLEQGMVRPVSEIEVGTGPLSLKEKANQASEKLRRHLDKVDPEFWRQYGEGGKVTVAEQLQQVVEEFFGPIEKQATALLEKNRAQLDRQRSELSRLEQDLQKTEKRQEELQARLQSLESPFGRLPLGMTDLITLFPLLLAGLMVMLTVALQRTNRLRIAFYQEHRSQQQPLNSVTLDLCTDCWFLPPYRSAARPVLVATALLLLLGVIVRSEWLVIAEPGAPALAEADVGVLRGKALAWVYAISAVVLLACLYSWWQILRRPRGHVAD
jgi:hypothetical protein